MPRRKLISLAALSAVTLAACRGGGAQQNGNDSAQAIAVRAAPVTDTLMARPIVAAGTAAPKDEITLSFKIGGVIDQVRVDAGDVVRAGQLLAALDLREIDATLSKAQSGAEKAERDLGRAERLYADSVVTLTQLQDTETAAAQARADLQAASVNRRYAVIVAPAAGTVLRRAAEAGETVSPGTTVLVLGSQARGNVVEVALADRDVVRVRRGDAAQVRFDALPGEVYHGQVTQIGAAADPATGTYTIEVTLRNAARVASGLVGQVEIRSSRAARTTLVPIEAILEADGDEATVFTLSADSSRAERRRVTVAFIDGRRVAVARGLEGIAAVLTDGAAYLSDGSAVRVTP